MLSTELFPEQYTVYRSDRKLHLTEQTTGGGVLLACKSEIRSEKLALPNIFNDFISIDVLCCKCYFNFTVVYVFVIYIPPNTNIDNFEAFFDSLEQIDFILGKNILVFGDFNVPQYVDNDTNDRKATIINNFLTFLDIQQHNNINNNRGRLLDLVFSNLGCEIVHDNAPLVNEDIFHPALYVTLSITTKYNNFQTKKTEKSYNFKKANYQALYSALESTDWYYLQNFQNVDIATKEFYDKLYRILDECVPEHKHYKRSYPQWYSKEIINNIKDKNKHQKNYKKTKNQHHLYKFKELRSLIKQQIDKAYDNYLTKVQNSISSDSKQFWSFVHSKKKTNKDTR